jgi:hypothetical protein
MVETQSKEAQLTAVEMGRASKKNQSSVAARLENICVQLVQDGEIADWRRHGAVSLAFCLGMLSRLPAIGIRWKNPHAR